MTSRPFRAIKRIVVAAIIGYLLLVFFLMILETSLVYPAPKYPLGNWNPVDIKPEDVHFKSIDGTDLHGWCVEHSNPRAVAIYFHGNGENVSNVSSTLKVLNSEFRLSVFAIDYRGYGKSSGSPHEQGLKMDALAAMDWLAERTGKEFRDIVVIGRSLGGGVGVHAAAERGCRALVLYSTFSTMHDAAAHNYFYVPVRLLMQNKFDSVSSIQKVSAPVIQFHGTSDKVIPFHLGVKLFDAIKSEKKTFVEMKGTTHNEAPPAEFWSNLNRFLETI